MKYLAKHYAHAFVELAPEAKTASAQGELVKNFWATVQKNGDMAKAQKIVAETEKLIRRADGRDLYDVETARKTNIPARDIVAGVATAKDVIRETVNPGLVAGVRITVNDERQLDVSLATKLNHLFKQTAL